MNHRSFGAALCLFLSVASSPLPAAAIDPAVVPLLQRSTAGGRELGLANRPPAHFNSLFRTQPWMGHELSSGEKGPRDLQVASSGRYQITLVTRRKTKF